MAIDLRALKDVLGLALRQALGHRRRTWLVAICVAIGNAVLILQLAQGQGQEKAFMHNMIHALSGHLQVQVGRPGTDVSLFAAKLQDALPLPGPEVLDARIARLPHVVETTRRLRFGGMLSGNELNWSGFIVGVQPESERRVCDAIELAAGRFVAAGASEIVVSTAVARDHGLKLGDSVTVLASTAQRSFNAMEFRIVGLLSENGLSRFYTRMAYIPIEQARRLVGLDADVAHELVIRLDDTARTAETAAAIRALLPGSAGGEVRVHSWLDLGGLFVGILDIGRAFRAAMALFLGAVILILVFSSFGVHVLERSVEAATLLALGWRRAQVGLLFVAEAVCVATLASLAGLLLGGGIAFWLGIVGIPAFTEALTYVFAGDRLYPVLRATDLLLLLLGTVVVAALAALLPVRRVLAQDLVQVLNRS